MEFAHFRGISMFSRNFAEFGTGRWYRGQIRHILVEFRPLYCVYTWFHHEIHDWHSGSNGRNTENIELSLSEILSFNLVDRLYLPVAVTGDKYCTFGGFRGQRKSIAISGKFAAVSRRIWKKIAAENCGPYIWTITAQLPNISMPQSPHEGITHYS